MSRNISPSLSQVFKVHVGAQVKVQGCHMLYSQVPPDPIRSVSHSWQSVSWDQSGKDWYLPWCETPVHPDKCLSCDPLFWSFFKCQLSFSMHGFLHCLHWAISACVFLGTDALCWEQELHGAWSASSGGLLSVHKLFCCGPITPYCRLWQSGPCFEETCFVSTEFGVKPLYLVCALSSLCCGALLMLIMWI